MSAGPKPRSRGETSSIDRRFGRACDGKYVRSTAAGCKVPDSTRRPVPRQKTIEAGASGNGRWARAMEGRSDVKDRGDEATSRSPAGRSKAAKGETSGALLRRQAAAKLCRTAKSRRAEHRRHDQPAMHDPRRTVFAPAALARAKSRRKTARTAAVNATRSDKRPIADGSNVEAGSSGCWSHRTARHNRKALKRSEPHERRRAWRRRKRKTPLRRDEARPAIADGFVGHRVAVADEPWR